MAKSSTAAATPAAAAPAAATDTAPAISTAGQKITVGCKFPHGLFLKLFKLEDTNEAVAGGGFRSVKKAVQYGPTIRINGPIHAFGQVSKHRVEGGYALTENVDADFFRQWREDNADSDLVKNNVIIAHEERDMLVGEAQEKVAVPTGQEPLERDKDKRIPTRMRRDAEGHPLGYATINSDTGV